MSFGAFKDYALATVTQGCHYHLWYLISLIYALPLFYLCVRFTKNRKLLFVLMIVLYIIKAISYGYTQWLPTFMQTIFGIGGKFSALFDAVFLLLPLLLLGFFIGTGPAPRCDRCGEIVQSLEFRVQRMETRPEP